MSDDKKPTALDDQDLDDAQGGGTPGLATQTTGGIGAKGPQTDGIFLETWLNNAKADPDDDLRFSSQAGGSPNV